MNREVGRAVKYDCCVGLYGAGKGSAEVVEVGPVQVYAVPVVDGDTVDDKFGEIVSDSERGCVSDVGVSFASGDVKG